MNGKSDDPVREADAARIVAKIEPDTVRQYRETTEDYMASIAVSLKRLADKPDDTRISNLEARVTALENVKGP